MYLKIISPGSTRLFQNLHTDEHLLPRKDDQLVIKDSNENDYLVTVTYVKWELRGFNLVLVPTTLYIVENQ